MTGRRRATGLRRLLILPVGLVLLAAEACRGPGLLPWERVPLPPEGIDTARVADGPVVHIDRVRFHSASMGDDRYFLALVPNGPEPATHIMVLNHGWLDRAEDLLVHLAIDRVYSDLLGKQAVARAIIVLPDLRIASRFGATKPRPSQRAVARYLGEEVAGFAARLYGIAADRSRWSVSGISFGGYMALDVALNFSQRFGGVGVVSGFYDRAWAFWPAAGAAIGRDGNAQTASPGGPPPRVLLACGTGDRFFKEMVSLHERFESSGTRHQWLTAPGGHTWQYWSTVVEPLLKFQLGGGDRVGDRPR